MTPTERLLDEGVGVFYEVKAAVAGLGEKVVSNELAIVGLMGVVRELLKARTADHEILRTILEACTREGSGELAEAIKHMEASIGRMDKTLADLTAKVAAALAVRQTPAGN